jgi:hypothetical protein
MKTLYEAVNRLKWSFSDGFNAKKGKVDIEAMNFILNHLKAQNEVYVNSNLLFSKMFAFTLKELLFTYSDINFSSKLINEEILSVSMGKHCEALKVALVQKELELYFKNLNLKPTWKVGQKMDEIRENIKENAEILKIANVEEFLSIHEQWDIDSVIANLNLNINLAINKYKNEK